MSAREFKPGEVAMVQGQSYLRTGNGWLFAARSGGTWSHAESGSADRITALAQPVAVINPADRRAISALLADYFAETELPSEREIDRMQDALMRLADPKPRIEEPTGLGAVVELVGGGVLVRTPAPIHDLAVWADMSGDFYPWSALDVAKVLHEGWSE